MNLQFPIIPPLWYQMPSWVAAHKGIKRKITSYPRRHGKDLEDLSMACDEALRRKGTYYYIFPTRKWAKRALWDNIVEIGDESKLLIDWIFPPEIVKRKNETDLFLEFYNGSMFFMGGSDNLDFVGQGGQGYTLSEFSLHKDAVTSLLSPIIRQSQAYLHLNGTLRGKENQLYKFLKNNENSKEWFTRWLRPQDTKLYCWVGDEININPEIFPLIDEINPLTGDLYKNVQNVPFYNIQDDIDSGMISHAYARQEYLNDIVSHVVGGYYGYEIKAMEDRHGVRPIDPNADHVYTFWDLGGNKQESDTTSITFAHINTMSKKMDVIDYYENTGHLRGHYFDILKEKGYRYAGHYFPHDGKRSNDWNGETSADTAMREHGVEIRFIPKTNNVLNDIEITRRSFRNISFDSNRCEPIITHVGNYHEKETTGKPCHQNNCSECHGASHGADTVRGMCCAVHLNLVEPYLLGNRSGYRKKQSVEIIDDCFIV